MRWVRARFREPSTWCAFGVAGLAFGVWLSTRSGWWREFVYLAALFSVAGTLMHEKGK